MFVTMSIHFYVDPRTNSSDPDVRMAYGLHVTSPWGGSVFINFPEHLEYMPGTQGIARHHDERLNVWQVEDGGARALYDVESLSLPGVWFRAEARAAGQRAEFDFSIHNKTQQTLGSIRAMFCHDYGSMPGFPARDSDNFEQTFVSVDDDLRAVADLPVRNRDARARMAQVRGCPDVHNWWAEEMGGLIEAPLDLALTAVRGQDGRHMALTWSPGKCLLTNRAIPCIHADPAFGDLPPGAEGHAHGTLVFGTGSMEELAAELRASVHLPRQQTDPPQARRQP